VVPKKVEQINDHLFIDTYKSNNIKTSHYMLRVISYIYLLTYLLKDHHRHWQCINACNS